MRQTVWDWRAAANFAGGAAGGGLAAWTGMAAAFGQPPNGRIASIVAVLFVGAGLALVAHEMGRPLRFLRVFFHPRTSWMSREALIAPLLLAALCVSALWGGREMMFLAGILGACLLFTQAQMLAAARGIPAWSQPQIVPLLVVSGLVEGGGLFLICASFGGAFTPFYLLLFLAVAVLRQLAWAKYDAASENLASSLARETLHRLDRPLLIGGTVVPGIAVALALVLPAVASPLAVLAGTFALASGWALRFEIVLRAGYTQGSALPHLPI